jgi:hypothetical protein
MERRGPISKQVKRLGKKKKIWPWVPTEPETKTDCAGEVSSNSLHYPTGDVIQLPI